MSNNNDKGFWIFVMISSATFALLSLGLNSGIAMVRKDAIHANVAEWTIDSKTGEKTFQWKNQKQ